MKKLMFILFLQIGFTQSPTIIFENANNSYVKGNYQDAIIGYKQILDSGYESPELYYNLGNSYYKLNKVAESNFYFEKALILSPNDTEVLNNLSFAKNLTIDLIEDLPKTQIQNRIDFITSFFSDRVWAYISIGSVILFFILSLLYLFSDKSSIKRFYFSLSLISLFFSIFFSSILLSNNEKKEKISTGIIFSKELPVFSEPNIDDEIFILHEGTKVEIIEKLIGWEKIKLSNGAEGWVVEGKIEKL